MEDELQDKKITQEQADYYMAPLELDLLALFKVMENDMLNVSEGYDGTPEKFIQEIMSYLIE